MLLALGTSACWALGNVLTQRLGRLVGPVRATVWALACGGLLAVPFAAILDARSEGFDAAVGAWGAAAAISGVVAYLGLFYAFANEGLSIAVPIVASWPVVSGVVAVGILGERLAGLRLAGAISVVLGVLLVSFSRSVGSLRGAQGGGMGRKPLLAAVASACGFGVMVPAMGRIAPATGAFGATVLVYAAGIAIAGVVASVRRVSLSPPPRTAWALCVATGAAETLGFVTVALARRYAPMTLVAPIASSSATVTVIIAWVALRERPPPMAVVGALLTGVGLALSAG